MHHIILLLGGNLGEVSTSLQNARALIEARIGSITKASSLYESEPWGFTHAQNFLNQVIEIQSSLEAHELLNTTQEIEKELGRTTKTSTEYEGRLIDIDILFYDDLVLQSQRLTVPHPHLQNRLFTLLPLNERWNNFIHPVLNKTIEQLLKECSDSCWARLAE